MSVPKSYLEGKKIAETEEENEIYEVEDWGS
jgi:hypothetical protein